MCMPVMTRSSETGLFESAVAQALFELPDHLPLEPAPSRAPLMTLLVKLGRPRTLVQVGLDRVGGYVAACSAARRHHTETACYGLWSGTEPPLLSHLEAVVAPFQPASRVISGDAEDLSAAFPDGGVDLLWLDAPCSAHDWRLWAPKLSTRAAVAVRDCGGDPDSEPSAHLWAELSASRPHMTFGLGSGFGVAMMGVDPPVALSRLFDTWASVPAFRELLDAAYGQAEHLLPGRIEARWRAQERASEAP